MGLRKFLDTMSSSPGFSVTYMRTLHSWWKWKMKSWCVSVPGYFYLQKQGRFLRKESMYETNSYGTIFKWKKIIIPPITVQYFPPWCIGHLPFWTLYSIPWDLVYLKTTFLQNGCREEVVRALYKCLKGVRGDVDMEPRNSAITDLLLGKGD